MWISFSTVGVGPWNRLWRVARLCSHQRVPQQLHQWNHRRAGTEKNRFPLERRHRETLLLRNRWEKHLKTLLRTSESTAAHIFPPPDRWDGAGCWSGAAEGPGLQHSWRNPPCFSQLRLRFLSPQRLGRRCQTCDLHQQQEGSGCGSRCSPGSRDLVLLLCRKLNIANTSVFFHSARVLKSCMCLSGWRDCFYF